VPVPTDGQDVVGVSDFSSFLHTQVRAPELERLPAGADTVLHGGCAGSWYFEWFEQCYPTPVRRHIGVEPFSPRPKQLPENVEWLPRTLGDLTPVLDDEVDLVYAGQVLEHAWPGDIASFFDEAHRVLRPRGTIALDSPNRRVTNALGWLHPEHTVELTVDEIAELLRLAGFDDVRVRGMWLCYDADEHRFLPLEALEVAGDWTWARRIEEAEPRPEDSFIWWAEATCADTPPDRQAIHEVVQQAYDTYRRLRFGEFRHEIGDRSRRGDNWIVEAKAGQVGYLVYGPNVPMPPGRWAATFRVGAEDGGPPEAVVATLDVVRGNETEPVATREVALAEISPDGALTELVQPFELARTEMGIQFRLHSTGQVGLLAELGVSVQEDAPRNRAPAVGFRDVDEIATSRPQPIAEEPPPPGARRGVGRSLGRAILWPLRRFVDPRVAGLQKSIDVTREHLSRQAEATRAEVAASTARGLESQGVMDEVRALVEADLEAATEAATIIGRGLAEQRTIAEATAAALGRLTPEALEQLADEGRVDELGEAGARFLNYASSHRGFAAQRNVWFNWPLSLNYEARDVKVEDVNERVAEVAYAFRAVAGLPPGAKILDVGATESTVAVSLASLGYEVTAIDPRPYPLEHPRLRVVVGSVEQWNPGEEFSAVLCISTLEHIGSGEYGQTAAADGDADALARLHALTERGGLLVLTTPFGEPQDGLDGARVYDRARLEFLLADWRVEDFTVVAREDATTWSPTDRGDPQGEAVALVTARRTS